MKKMLIMGACFIMAGFVKIEAAKGSHTEMAASKLLMVDKVRIGSQVNPKSKPVKKPAAAVSTGKSGAKPITILISTIPDIMQYDKKSFTVKAGQKVIIEFDNQDNMQHNLVLIKAGALDKVGLAADDLARDPKGAEKSYTPQMPEVLHATKLLNPQESFTLQFTAPAQPGDYPYVCTFPGHWRIMKGVMKVVK